MAFVPTVESAQKSINSSRVIYQDALASVAEGRAKLQAAVDSGQVEPGTQEYLNLKNQLVNSPEAQAETAKMQYDKDLSNLDNARAYAAGDNSVLGLDTGKDNYVSPATNPQANDNQVPIVGAGDINVSSNQVNSTTQNSNPGFVYNNQGELVPADSVTADTVPASEIDTSAKPAIGDAVVDAQQASGTQDQFTQSTFGTTAPASSLVDPEVLAMQAASNTDTVDFTGSPKPVIGDGVVDAQLASNTDSTAFTTGSLFDTSYGNPDALAAAQQEQAMLDQARLQSQVQSQQKSVNGQDWRVRLSLAPGATYLYKDSSGASGILQPLQTTDGVLFPYTPSIDTQYRANYSAYDLTHSNYRGYFYQNSFVDAINVRGVFTAQDTQEAAYLLAVIHFFRAVTKMFYGSQDTNAGSPPPLVFLSGLGEYQFNKHPCLVQAFNYTLPPDVDYIRAGSPNVNNTNLTYARQRPSALAGVLQSLIPPSINRLLTGGLPQGGIRTPPAPPTLGQTRPNYVPTKMEIAITLLPVQSRAQVSKQFNMRQFANGDLLKGGFW